MRACAKGVDSSLNDSNISVFNEGVDVGVKGQTLVINVTQQEKSPKSIFFNQG